MGLAWEVFCASTCAALADGGYCREVLHVAGASSSASTLPPRRGHIEAVQTVFSGDPWYLNHLAARVPCDATRALWAQRLRFCGIAICTRYSSSYSVRGLGRRVVFAREISNGSSQVHNPPLCLLFWNISYLTISTPSRTIRLQLLCRNNDLVRAATMKHTYTATLLLLAAASSLAWEPRSNDQEAAARYHQDRAERLRTRSLLEAREECSRIDCMEGGDAACVDAGCEVCGASYYCVGYNDVATLPTLDEMVVAAGSSDIKDKPAVLTNFLEAGQFKDHWAASICNEITKIPSNQDTDAGKWYYSIQGTHKRAMSLTHDKEYLTVLVTWEPSDKRLLPKFDGMKVDLCKKALQAAAANTHQLEYGAFNSKSVASLKNRHAIAISTPRSPDTQKQSKRGRAGNTIAFINIELGDHSKEVGLFNGNGLPPP
jgi:hypothetical protein